MEASIFPSSPLPRPPPPPKFEPNTEAIKQRLLKKGVNPTPKIVNALRKKEILKHKRKLDKIALTQQPPPLTPSQQQVLAEESYFRTIKREYRAFKREIDAARGEREGVLVGKPWERIEKVRFREVVSESKGLFNGGGLRKENLRQLKEIFEGNLSWVLEDDIEVEDGGLFLGEKEGDCWDPAKRRQSEREAIRFLVEKLSCRGVTVKDWKLARIMKLSGLKFTEGQLMKIVEGLGHIGKWEQALVVVEWVYQGKERGEFKSRFVYTKLLSVLGKQRRPLEALSIFNKMREDRNIYPDIAAYHCIAVTLGQAGLLKELLKTIECMRQKPKRINNMRENNWDPELEPDVVIYNAVLNACVATQQWKGVSWVFEHLQKSGLKPNAATYGLAMEVMLHSGKYDLVHHYFAKMNISGKAPKANTYRVLVKAFWEEGRVDEAVEAVRDMEQRGVVGTACVFYELACCLCNNGRLQDAMLEVEKMERLHRTKPLQVTFTGMILSALEGGYVEDCISIFRLMKAHCSPNIGTINTMLRIYGRNDLFTEAKELFEGIKAANAGGNSLTADAYTYSAMLEACAHAHQWDYFEYVYKQMVFAGYQLDQCKHASLLVEASVHGKVHILEHAFDATLEAEEIPHPSFFTELVLQAIARQNYERAIALINTMAYAPFQLSERQWTELFERNKYRLISTDALEVLLRALDNCDSVSEVTVSNLTRSLQFLCRSCSSRSTSTSSYTSGIESSCLDTPASESKTGKVEVNQCSSDGEGYNDSRLQSHVSVSDETSRHVETETLDDDIANCDFLRTEPASNYTLSRCTDDNDAEFGGLEAGGDALRVSNSPSADEILGIWRESRVKDGIFFPFQLGQYDKHSSS